MVFSPPEFLKQQANEAFKTGDYNIAAALYTHAMRLDAKNPIYILNRAMANLKLANWQDAEDDASSALKLIGQSGNAQLTQKALFRRSRARKAQGNADGARKDLHAYIAQGGQKSLADAEVSMDSDPFDKTSLGIQAPPFATSHSGFEIKETAIMGQGVFATRGFQRGDLILAEKPLFTVSDSEYGPLGHQAVLSAVKRLSPRDLTEFMSLSDTFSGSATSVNIIVDTFRTNSLPGGLCILASRFNHSCMPNARYSWHAQSGRLRIFALKEIAVGEEIHVMYIQGRNVYGSTRNMRRSRLKTNMNFDCHCAACSLEGAALTASDARRREAAALYEGMMMHEPQFDGAGVLRDVVRAIGLLREEGYFADVDDFAQDASGLCAMHSDWESAKYWAKLAYDSKCAEFGKDHDHARKAKKQYDNPRSHPQVGMYSGQKFSSFRI